MSDAAPDKLRYPIGQFTYGGLQTAEQRRERIERIAAAPTLIRLVPAATCAMTTAVAELAMPGMLWCSASQ